MKKEIDFWKTKGNSRLNHKLNPHHITNDSIKLAKAGIGLAVGLTALGIGVAVFKEATEGN